jgi:hypothetical protein
MLAHVEQVQHVHPHPAGAPWEAIIVGVVLVALCLAIGRLRLRSRPGVAAEK